MQTPTPQTIPELTLRAVLIGLVLSVVMGAANVYLGLKVGMTVSASIPAAVLAMLILRAFTPQGTILEANQAQTAASAGESLAAGIIFTMPALVLIGVWQQFDMLLTTLIAFTGGLLGILLMIPMRRVFVVPDSQALPKSANSPSSPNLPTLKFPEGVACAAVLRAGEQQQTNSRDARAVMQGATFGFVFKLLISFVGALKGTLEGAFVLGQRIFYVGGDISVALLGVGLIVQLNVAVLIFIGGALGWLVALPLLGATPELVENPVEGAYAIWSTQVRYIGVGAMVVGGMAAIVQVRSGLVQALQALFGTRSPSSENDAAGVDLPVGSLIVLTALCIALISGLYFVLTSQLSVTIVTTVIMLIMAFFFTAVASYIVGLVGNSNSPVSGMTITAVLFTGALLLLFGFSGTTGMLATLGVAAIVCCTACTAGDVCNDLKTGQLVGATPWRQQVMQIAGVAVAAGVMAPVLQLLHDTTPGGIGGRELAAPQAQLFASLARGFFGEGELPWSLVVVGAVIGVCILGIDYILQQRQVDFRAHLMPVAVGMYLPFGLSVPILIGGILAFLITKKSSRQEPDIQPDVQPGVLLASGAIAGEALMGVGLALLASIDIARLSLGLPDAVLTGLTVLAVLITLVFFYRRAQQG